MIARQQNSRLRKPQILTLRLENNLSAPATIVRAMTPADLVLNDSPKTTRIRQKYNISLRHKTAIDFSSPNARLVTYSNSFGSFHEVDLFSNLGNVPVEPPAQPHNTAINTQEINSKTKLPSRRLAKKKARKAATAAKKAEFTAAKKADAAVAKLKKAEAAEKCAIEKKALKAEADMKKFDDRAAKNLHNAMEKSQTTKRKAALLITDGNATKKCRNNGEATNTEEKPENKPKVEKKPIG